MPILTWRYEHVPQQVSCIEFLELPVRMYL